MQRLYFRACPPKNSAHVTAEGGPDKTDGPTAGSRQSNCP
jgi:hypothetical protein